MASFISRAKSSTVSGSSVTPRVKRISLLWRAARTSSLPHQPRPTIAALSMSVAQRSGRARLLERMRLGKGGDLHAARRDAHHGRIGRDIDLEEAGPGDLRGDADVGHRDTVAVREGARLLVAREMRLHRGKPLADPVPDPFLPRRIVPFH